MALPHPKSRKDNYGNGHIPNNGGVVRKFLKGTINVTDYRNPKDNVNPAKDRTFHVNYSFRYHVCWRAQGITCRLASTLGDKFLQKNLPLQRVKSSLV